MTPRYPILVDLAARPVVVVGGGAVAERRALGLLAAGADLRVVSPRVGEGIDALAARGELTVERRPYRTGDLAGAVLAVAATDDPEVNRRVAADGRAAGVPVNRVDHPDGGDVTVPAVLRRGDLTVAVATSGRTPGLAGALRRRLEADQATWQELLAPEVLDAVRRGATDAVRERIRGCRSSSSA